jgi:hypothetical protein
MSGPYRDGHGLRTEIEDLDALLRETGVRRVFGLSAGAVIAIEAALALGTIEQLAVYEPPLAFDGIVQAAFMPRYERELAAGRLAAALVTVMRGTADRTPSRYVPRFLQVGLLSLVMRTVQGRPVPEGMVSVRDLISTIHYDAITVDEARGALDRFTWLTCDVLLLGGARSARNLTAVMDALSTVLPRARRVTLPSAGHTAPDNGGRPQLVAIPLRSFFA